MHAQQSPQEHTNFADIMLLLTANTVLHFGLAVAHELGHIAIAKLFVSLGAPLAKDPIPSNSLNINEPVSISHDPNNPDSSLSSNTTLSVLATYPEFENSLLNALVVLAGPAAGALASYTVLKATNVIVELNHQNELVRAIKNGLKKPAFNDEQPQSIKGLAFAHMLLNGFALIPYQANNGAFLSEGQKIRQAIFRK
jgi:hypothetical protein